MTPSEAKQIIQTLQRRTRTLTLDTDDRVLWTTALARFDLDAAMIAAGRVPATEINLTRFVVEAQTVTRELASTTTGRDERQTRNAIGLAGVAKARAALAAVPLPYPDWDAETEPVAS